MAAAIPLMIAVGTGSALTIAGAALGAIGALTGNKTLGIIGAFVGLASGVINASGSVAGDAFSGTGLVVDAADDFAGAASAADALADVATSAAGVENVLAGTDPSTFADPLSQGAVDANAVPGAAVNPLAPDLPPTEGVFNDYASGIAEGSGLTDAQLEANRAANAVNSGPSSAPGKGLLDRFQGWFKENPALAKVSGDFIKGGFEGALKSKSNAELMAIYRQRNITVADQQALQRELAARGIKNAGYVPNSIGMSLNQDVNLYPAGTGPSAYRFGGLSNAMGR